MLVRRLSAFALSLALASGLSQPAAHCQANTVRVPQKILRARIDLGSPAVSPAARQLADQLGLTPVLAELERLCRTPEAGPGAPLSLESLAARQQRVDLRLTAGEMIENARLDIDFVLAEIVEEQNLYSELLLAYTSQRDRSVAITNAVSFGTNGVLWAVAEALAIPTFSVPKISISSGVTGILAGVVPSIASLHALRQVGGKRYGNSEAPNMLARLFDYPPTADTAYPASVWLFLNSVPAGDASGKTRRDQIIDRWIADRNIPSFTDRTSKRQLDLITASEPYQKNVTIDLLTTRKVMLEQLSAEVFKMSRLLMELMMVVRGEKQLSPVTDS